MPEVGELWLLNVIKANKSVFFREFTKESQTLAVTGFLFFWFWKAPSGSALRVHSHVTKWSPPLTINRAKWLDVLDNQIILSRDLGTMLLLELLCYISYILVFDVKASITLPVRCLHPYTMYCTLEAAREMVMCSGKTHRPWICSLTAVFLAGFPTLLFIVLLNVFF